MLMSIELMALDDNYGDDYIINSMNAVRAIDKNFKLIKNY